jgi:hypothetical protein
MLGDTAFALGIWPRATREGLLRTWERFALPMVDAQATGTGDLPSMGPLLEIRGDTELSGVQRRDGELEVCLWNPHTGAPAEAVVGGRKVELGPAAISRVRI